MPTVLPSPHSIAAQLRAAAQNLDGAERPAFELHLSTHGDYDSARETADAYHALAVQCRQAAQLVERGIPDHLGVVPKLLAEADELVGAVLNDFARVLVPA